MFAKTRDGAVGNGGDHTLMTPRFASLRFAQVHFDHFAGERSQRIVNAPGVVGESSRVDHDRVVVRTLDPLDQFRCAIGLPMFDRQTEVGRFRGSEIDYLLQCGRAVYRRLP